MGGIAIREKAKTQPSYNPVTPKKSADSVNFRPLVMSKHTQHIEYSHGVVQAKVYKSDPKKNSDKMTLGQVITEIEKNTNTKLTEEDTNFIKVHVQSPRGYSIKELIKLLHNQRLSNAQAANQSEEPKHGTTIPQKLKPSNAYRHGGRRIINAASEPNDKKDLKREGGSEKAKPMISHFPPDSMFAKMPTKGLPRESRHIKKETTINEIYDLSNLPATSSSEGLTNEALLREFTLLNERVVSRPYLNKSENTFKEMSGKSLERKDHSISHALRQAALLNGLILYLTKDNVEGNNLAVVEEILKTEKNLLHFALFCKSVGRVNEDSWRLDQYTARGAIIFNHLMQRYYSEGLNDYAVALTNACSPNVPEIPKQKMLWFIITYIHDLDLLRLNKFSRSDIKKKQNEIQKQSGLFRSENTAKSVGLKMIEVAEEMLRFTGDSKPEKSYDQTKFFSKSEATAYNELSHVATNSASVKKNPSASHFKLSIGTSRPKKKINISAEDPKTATKHSSQQGVTPHLEPQLNIERDMEEERSYRSFLAGFAPKKTGTGKKIEVKESESNQLTKEEHQALTNYVLNDYTFINPYMWGDENYKNKGPWIKLMSDLKKRIEGDTDVYLYEQNRLIQNALLKLKPVGSSIKTVYRQEALGGRLEKFKDLARKEEEYVTPNAFSTRSSKEAKQSFRGSGGYEISLQNQAHHGIPVSAYGINKRADENEVLFPQGSKFRVDKVEGNLVYMTALGRKKVSKIPDQHESKKTEEENPPSSISTSENKSSQEDISTCFSQEELAHQGEMLKKFAGLKKNREESKAQLDEQEAHQRNKEANQKQSGYKEFIQKMNKAQEEVRAILQNHRDAFTEQQVEAWRIFENQDMSAIPHGTWGDYLQHREVIMRIRQNLDADQQITNQARTEWEQTSLATASGTGLNCFIQSVLMAYNNNNNSDTNKNPDNLSIEQIRAKIEGESIDSAGNPSSIPIKKRITVATELTATENNLRQIVDNVTLWIWSPEGVLKDSLVVGTGARIIHIEHTPGHFNARIKK